MKTSRFIELKRGYCIHQNLGCYSSGSHHSIRNSINMHFDHINIFFSVSGLQFIFVVQNQFSFEQKKKMQKKQKSRFKNPRDVMGVIFQTCQDRTTCCILFKKTKKSPKNYFKFVSHFGKDFLFWLVLSIEIDPAGYNNVINHIQKNSELDLMPP